MTRALVLSATLCLTAATRAQNHVDAQGREWRQVNAAVSFTWNQLAEICPTDGATPASGTIGAIDFSGWVWATREQVQQLFAEFVPDMATQTTVGGPQYTLPALWFVDGVMRATYAFYSTYSNSLMVDGWTATRSDDTSAFRAYAYASYPVYNGAFSVDSISLVTHRHSSIGAWMFRPPATACATLQGDANNDKQVDGTDLAVLLAQFGQSVQPGASADFNADGEVTGSDLSTLLASFGSSC